MRKVPLAQERQLTGELASQVRQLESQSVLPVQDLSQDPTEQRTRAHASRKEPLEGIRGALFHTQVGARVGEVRLTALSLADAILKITVDTARACIGTSAVTGRTRLVALCAQFGMVGQP